MTLIHGALTPSTAASVAELVTWARDYLTAPYPGPGFHRNGALCPYARKMVEDDRLRVLLAPAVTGEDPEQLLQATLEFLAHTLAVLEPDNIDTALVLGFPTMSHGTAIDCLDPLLGALNPAMIEAGMNFAAVLQMPGSAPTDPWPLGAQAPMPALVVRRMGPWDAVFPRTAAYAQAYHQRYAAWYADGRMTPHDARAFAALCATWELPLPDQAAPEPAAE